MLGVMDAVRSPTLSLPVHGSYAVTYLLLSNEQIITASDDHTIHVYSLPTGQRTHLLQGHVGGVWCLGLGLAGDTLVSGSTDRTIRVWDLRTSRCTHVFGGHSGTVRALVVLEQDGAGATSGEGLSDEPIIVSGSRDASLMVWTLPRHGDPEYAIARADIEACVNGSFYDYDDMLAENPYHLTSLRGHSDAIRDIAGQGNVLVSASYDNSVRVWDLTNGVCTWVLIGHTDKVYTVALDLPNHQVYSGSMDTSIRLWDLHTGQCKRILSTTHTPLVGLLSLSPSYLMSGSADTTLRLWDRATGAPLHVLQDHRNPGAVTAFQHDDSKAVSGCSSGRLKLWNLATGAAPRDLLTGVAGVWQVKFWGKWCAAVSTRRHQTVLDVWDFEGLEDWFQEEAAVAEAVGANGSSRAWREQPL